MSATALGEYWRKHFSARHAARSDEGVARSLDYSNERVQAQTYAVVLEAAGPIAGRSVWDVGCGWGRLARLFDAAGARVTASDIVPETIATLQREEPGIEWTALNVMDDQAVAAMPEFDCVVACEILQHVRHDVIVRLWSHVRPGGRLVGCVSNRDCPIVASVIDRYPDTYFPMRERELLKIVSGLDSVDSLWLKGLSFRDDQRIAPYSVSDWSGHLDGEPNRFVFTLVRTADGPR